MKTDYVRKYCQLVLSSQYFTFTSLHSTHGSKEVLPYAPLLAASFKRKNHIVFAKEVSFCTMYRGKDISTWCQIKFCFVYGLSNYYIVRFETRLDFIT